jgi:hypothetical protein
LKGLDEHVALKFMIYIKTKTRELKSYEARVTSFVPPMPEKKK